MQIPKKLNNFSCIFLAFLESILNFEHFKKKNEPANLSIFDVIDSEC